MHFKNVLNKLFLLPRGIYSLIFNSISTDLANTHIYIYIFMYIYTNIFTTLHFDVYISLEWAIPQMNAFGILIV